MSASTNSSPPVSRVERLAAFFRARPHEWHSGPDLARIAGFASWRTRVSDCRLQFGMSIENKLVRVEHQDGSHHIDTLYRYTPPAEVSQPVTDLFGHVSGPSSKALR